MKISERYIKRAIQESIKKVLREGLPEVEDVPIFYALNEHTSLSLIGEILESYVYDKNDNCIGRLGDLHFKYDVANDRLLGARQAM